MLSKEQLNEIRELLFNSQNPLFFFDNDADGLCSFLIMQRSLGRGKGIPIKSYPALSSQYLRKVSELNPDRIFVLDKAEVSEEFIKGVKMKNLEIVWIDHHKSLTSEELQKETKYFNTYPDSEPTTYIAQNIFNRNQDLWLAMIGCIADVYMPPFAKDFEDKYPELFNSNLSAFESLHLTEIGKYAMMLNFGLMNSITNVVKLIKLLSKSKGPYDLNEENFYTKEFHKRYNELNSELQKLSKKAKEKKSINKKFIYFIYSGATSMSAILASKIYFQNPNKTIVVGYKRPEKINLSIRGENALKFTNKIIKEIEGSTGGGHEQATGAMIPATQLEKLEELIKDFKS
jgi:single-stranded DNA-specific DHH superfamily exonuclease